MQYGVHGTVSRRLVNTIPPAVSERDWRLKIGGLVRQPTEHTLAQLKAYEPLQQFFTLASI